MTNVFNTSFENSLRVLLLLASNEQSSKSLDMITALDFVAINNACFDVNFNNRSNLHGENPFAFCEYTARRELISTALKELALKGLIAFERTNNGFEYRITKQGKLAADRLDSEYAESYREATLAVAKSYLQNLNERQLIEQIDRMAKWKRGGNNG